MSNQESQQVSPDSTTDPSSSATGEPSKTSFIETPGKGGYSFMEKRKTYNVIVDDEDVTPDNIVDPDFVTMIDTFTHAAFESKQRTKSEVALKAKSTADMGMNVFATTISLDDIHIDHTQNTEEGYIPYDGDLEVAPSAFYLHKKYAVMSYPPEVFVVLKETETVFLFELPCFSYEKNTAEAAAVEEENEFYQYITVGKGKNRKMVVEETQTKQCVLQSRHTLAIRPQKQNASAFASMWDMHDTYAKLANVKPAMEPDEMVLYQSAAPTLLRKKRVVLDKTGHEKKGKIFGEVATMPPFLDAVLITERVLSTTVYSDAQKIFRGLVGTDPLSLDLIYIYTMKPLWTLECDEAANRPIASVSFNPKNEDILAVAHGKYSYAESFKGLVNVWCTKNPCIPERTYHFDDPVTSVAFSDQNPNWLGCGFVNGDVLILDITSYTIKTVAKSKRDTNPCFEPIWALSWRGPDKESQYLMATCQDGRINKFTSTKTHDFICTPMMRISTVEGQMKGMDVPKQCIKADVAITRNPAALCMLWHPRIQHVYLVGTDEGCIHKCSTHYLNQHMDVFRAHSGPVYSLKYSPFMGSLLVSCGADSAIRFWIEGMDEVIMTLNCPSPVFDIAFCPINSTILLSASGNVLSIWDLRRKNHMPCAEYSFPAQVCLTYVKFSSSGQNVFVGDTLGRVHTFHLQDTPIPPFYQKHLLDEAIKNALCTRPQLLRQLDKLKKFKEKYSKQDL
ncbi:unnamed protein product [Leptidea sinapis]|uniref:Dynein axonemal intermediate chain 4 n=1 Tax=Leptidea sinapis TaxID=189913 RepID=A0A5E4PV11_9NEOP|nr:unnamed protein product [Leptidea sinapis]